MTVSNERAATAARDQESRLAIAAADQLAFTRVHQRIDETNNHLSDIRSTLSELTAAVERSLGLCEVCRPKVLGNGKQDGYDTKIARLEENQIPSGITRMQALETTLVVSKWWMGLIGTVGGALGGIIVAIIRHYSGS